MKKGLTASIFVPLTIAGLLLISASWLVITHGGIVLALIQVAIGIVLAVAGISAVIACVLCLSYFRKNKSPIAEAQKKTGGIVA